MKLVKIFESIALLFVYITLSIAHLVQLCPKPPWHRKHAQTFEIGTKRGIYSDFQRHEARPIYCDILDPIYRPPESGIVLGGLLSGYCQ